ncbi:cytochrome C oxidase subunit IV family protein [Actinomycetospora sp. TBRC 11914]|uniref:cytochrome C oxidase subunit IV family protein n=1 Tax=Actinomycetospora sp. TBRC 11914 TaxID=2729387 RepID=UPI00145F5C62|nr:cytochrome C oxidase subunit IV family protein [Actinomycetospora sp. TBRC 11914]NMO91578.1 cytochrome C oxidase subunit IV family protein [Actinomycetospora sp. TBRC 11914]
MNPRTPSAARFSLRDAPFLTWAALVVLTLISLWLGRGHDVGGMGIRVAGVLVLAVAFVKVTAVMGNFMELRQARRSLRLGAGAALLVVAAVTIVLFLLV